MSLNAADRAIEKYERLLEDSYWPASQEAARRAVIALLRALKGTQ
jgi:hypothetical protein